MARRSKQWVLTWAVLGAGLVLGFLATAARAGPPGETALRVAVAQVAEQRTLIFPDSLPLRVEEPLRTMTAQPRRLPEQIQRALERALAHMEGIALVKAPELGPAPSPQVVRAVAERRRLDAVLAASLSVGYGQMQARGYGRRSYVGRVRVAVAVLSGRTGLALATPFVLEGFDDIEVDFRRRFDYDALHHRGAGPEVRLRLEEAVRVVSRGLREKLSGTWLEAVLEAEDRNPAPQALLSVEKVTLEPATLRSGETARMIITYTLGGLAPGTVVTVTESRRLVREDRLVAGPFLSAHALGNGRHTSVQDIHLPPTAEAGRYTIIATVEAGGARASGSSIFTVAAP